MKNSTHLLSDLADKKVQNRLFANTKSGHYTYAALKNRIDKTTTLLQQYQLKIGDSVLLSAKDDFDIASLFLACISNGITALLVDSATHPQRVATILELCTPKLLIVEDELNTKWFLEQQSIPVVKIKAAPKKKGGLFNKLLGKKKTVPTSNNSYFPSLLKTLPVGIPPSTIPEDTIAYILFTSGTTALPKGVPISHKNLFTHLATLSKVYHLNNQSNLLNLMPLYHTDGIIQGPILAFFNQATWHRPLTFDIGKITEVFTAIYKYRITHFLTVPTILSFMDKFSEDWEDSFQTDDFQFITSSASKLDIGLWERFEEKFQTKIVNVYGLTETVAGSLYSGFDEATRKVGTIGKPIDCDVKIVDETGQELAAGEQGELLLKGAHITSHYFNNPSATATAFQDGWFYTGDLAIKDCEGFYSITGRKKNVVISGGVNIYPEEVIEVMNTHPAVLESACIGVEDALFGEKLVAGVVLKNRLHLTDNELIEHCRSHLENRKLPVDIHFLTELPKTLSGKVQLRALKEQIKTINPLESSVSKDFNDRIFAAAEDAFKVKISNLKMEDTARTLDGWDSMAHLIFITNLEETFKVRFSTAEVITLTSLQTAQQMLQQKLALYA